jgi:RNA polymerase sigma factor (sigma-70 family)
MNTRQSDFEWLQQFARAGDQNSFRDLVRRHVDLVFGTAMRKVADAGGAQEISQNVFTALARKTWRFAPDDSLPAWLHKATLLESQAWLRGELRRRRREEAAVALGTTMNTSDESSAIRNLVPLLDEALLSLREGDRTALLLRYYESHSLREVGAALGVTEDTAQKRVATALDRIAQFFQRRGFKTATAAASAAALQHTAASASALTVSLVSNVALQAAPPALTGLSLLVARLASMTKAQTAAVCLVLAAVPVAWQLHEQRDSQAALARVNSQLAAAQSQFTADENELQRLNQLATDLGLSLETTRAAAALNLAAAQKFAAWKAQVRARLLAADYQWPEDLPFVRIPKAILPQMDVYHPITPPGVLRSEACELLGMTPAEREQAEASLTRHFAAMDDLMAANRYETNRTRYAHIPSDATGRVWGLPALGDGVKRSAEDLQSALQATLGAERWPMVAEQLKSTGSDTPRRILNLDAGEKGQELAAWIQERDGQLLAGYSWGEPNGYFNSGGVALSLFLPDARLPDGQSADDYVGSRQVAGPLIQPALEWLRQQAETRLGKKGNL